MSSKHKDYCVVASSWREQTTGINFAPRAQINRTGAEMWKTMNTGCVGRKVPWLGEAWDLKCSLGSLVIVLLQGQTASGRSRPRAV